MEIFGKWTELSGKKERKKWKIKRMNKRKIQGYTLNQILLFFDKFMESAYGILQYWKILQILPGV